MHHNENVCLPCEFEREQHRKEEQKKVKRKYFEWTIHSKLSFISKVICLTFQMPKTIYDPEHSFIFKNDQQQLKAAYFPQSDIRTLIPDFDQQLEAIPFTRVEYISQYGKRNRTPRETWCYGQVDSEVVSFSKRGYRLNFRSEPMPAFLQQLSEYCRSISKLNFNFDPEYNSCIIGKYSGKEDAIAFHFDTEPFLAHHFCANVTIGSPRDFQFRDEHKNVHEVKLSDTSIFFFEGLEHALPKRAAVKSGETRYSISFRNMKSDLGISNSFYYCRGLNGAISDPDKDKYLEKLNSL